MTPAARAALLVALLGACSRRAPVTSCSDNLAGAWITDRGERWAILDHRHVLESYPMFDDTRPPNAPAGLEIGPRVIDLERGARRGEVKRRYGQAGIVCVAKTPLRVTSCADDTLELVLADPTPPISFTPCAWGRPEPSRRERWRRE
ncbi:MAG: hypothetical protein H0T46_25530 [Deltaproteobacteria bacterium]|nr:hypothetical protein [Deltaproteobacteria bacterium]